MNANTDRLVSSPTYMVHKLGAPISGTPYFQPGCGANSKKNASREITQEESTKYTKFCKKCFPV